MRLGNQQHQQLMYYYQEHWIERYASVVGTVQAAVFLLCVIATMVGVLDGQTMIGIWICLTCLEYLKEKVWKPFLYRYVEEEGVTRD